MNPHLALSQELVDQIVDYLHDDLPALHAASLIAREFVIPCRRYLFRSIVVNSGTSVRNLLGILSQPDAYIATFIQDVTISFSAAPSRIDSEMFKSASDWPTDEVKADNDALAALLPLLRNATKWRLPGMTGNQIDAIASARQSPRDAGKEDKIVTERNWERDFTPRLRDALLALGGRKTLRVLVIHSVFNLPFVFIRTLTEIPCLDLLELHKVSFPTLSSQTYIEESFELLPKVATKSLSVTANQLNVGVPGTNQPRCRYNIDLVKYAIGSTCTFLTELSLKYEHRLSSSLIDGDMLCFERLQCLETLTWEVDFLSSLKQQRDVLADHAMMLIYPLTMLPAECPLRTLNLTCRAAVNFNPVFFNIQSHVDSLLWRELDQIIATRTSTPLDTFNVRVELRVYKFGDRDEDRFDYDGFRVHLEGLLTMTKDLGILHFEFDWTEEPMKYDDQGLPVSDEDEDDQVDNQEEEEGATEYIEALQHDRATRAGLDSDTDGDSEQEEWDWGDRSDDETQPREEDYYGASYDPNE